jgi:voltage-gated potassium channel
VGVLYFIKVSYFILLKYYFYCPCIIVYYCVYQYLIFSICCFMKKTFTAKILVAISLLFLWVSLGTLVFHRLEDWTWIQSFYFSVVSVTTVGYWDLAPSNDISRLFTAFYIIIGVWIGVSSLWVLGNQMIQNRENKILQGRMKKRISV